MNVQQAAFNTLTKWKADWTPLKPFPEPVRDIDGLRLHHAAWMLDQIMDRENGAWGNDKLNRWLGYAQGLLVCYRVLTLKEVKNINHAA